MNKEKIMEEQMKRYRHGDVELIRIEVLPEGLKSLGKRKELAYGEVTGHAHRIDIGEMFETKNGELYLKVEKMANLSHEEHKTMPVEPGIYRVGIKRQYDPENGWSNVQD